MSRRREKEGENSLKRGARLKARVDGVSKVNAIL